MLLLKEILDPKYGMFSHYQETRTIWFSELSLEEQGMYFLIGKPTLIQQAKFLFLFNWYLFQYFLN